MDARNSVATGDLKNAKILIDEAGEDPKFQGDPQYWFWKGYIYKELYKEQDKGVTAHSKLRDDAVEAFNKMLLGMRDKVSEDSISSAMKNLNYLASTYFNDAVLSLDTVKYESAIENYNHFRDISRTISPEADMRERDIKFKMKLATIYVALYEVRANSPAGDVFFEKAKNEYKEIIEIDKSNLTANYNLGIHFYNRAVNIIKNLDVETSIEELAKKEDICVELFLKALPYVKTAYELDPQRKETLIGLTGIYWSLNDLEKYQLYKDKLAELE